MELPEVLVTQRRPIVLGAAGMAVFITVPYLIGVRTTVSLLVWALFLIAVAIAGFAGWFATEADDANERKTNRNVAGMFGVCAVVLWFLNPGFTEAEPTPVDDTTVAQQTSGDDTDNPSLDVDVPAEPDPEPVDEPAEAVVEVKSPPVVREPEPEPSADEIERADEAMREIGKRYVRASDLKEYDRAFDLAEESITDHKAALVRNNVYTPMVRFYYYHGYMGVYQNLVDNGEQHLDQAWLDRARRMTPPDPREFKECLLQYGLSRYFLAHHYLKAGEFGEAQASFAAGEHAVANSDDPMLDDPQVRAVLRQGRSEFEASMRSQRSMVGSYVTNNGLLQKWIGRVIRESGQTITVRITWNNSSSDFKAGKEATLIRDDECKPLKSVCIEALLKGYK